MSDRRWSGALLVLALVALMTGLLPLAAAAETAPQPSSLPALSCTTLPSSSALPALAPLATAQPVLEILLPSPPQACSGLCFSYHDCVVACGETGVICSNHRCVFL
jgi:hypothetical protein